MTQEQKDAWWYQTIEYKRKLDGQWKKKMLGVFEKQKKIVLENLGKDSPFKIEKAKKKKPNIESLLWDQDEQVRTTISVIKPEYYNSMMAGSTMASQLIGEEAVNILAIPKVVEWLDYVADKYGDEITQTTRDDVRRIFQTAFTDGQSTNEVQEQVENYFDNIATYRAEMISRTETARALTASQGFVWEDYGFEKVEWYAEPTACPEICIPLSSEKWTVEEAQSGVVEYSHPNCECRFLPLK